MRFELFLAIRFLRQGKRLTLARLTAIAAVVATACGVAATIFAVALANGFRREMQTKILQTSAHVTIVSADNKNIFDWRNVAEQVAETNGVKSIQATSADNALLVGKNGSSYALIRGAEKFESKVQILNPSDNNRIAQLNDANPKTKIQNIQVEIGRELAEKLGLRIGDAATIVSGAAELLSNQGELNRNFAPVTTTVEIGSVFFSTGFYESEAIQIRASPADAARITGKSSVSVTALEVETADIYGSNIIARKIENVLGADFKIVDWQIANRALFAALTLERRIAVLIVSIVIFIAVLNVSTALALAANERRADVAILKTCGASAKRIVLIFLLQGAILGATGAVCGGLIGVVVCEICNRFGLINLPPEVYSINTIVLQPEIYEILLIVGTAFLLSLIASAFAALLAARIKPLENLKN